MRRVLVTGAAGLVGAAVARDLAVAGYAVRGAVRRRCAFGAGIEALVVGDIGGEVGGEVDWPAALVGVDAVVHAAARVHVSRETAADPAAEYMRVNVEATRRLATAAARSGVGRLVFLSTVKIHGEETKLRPFTEDDAPAPDDAYGESKRRAEEALAEIAAATGLEIVVLRPPLVYGPGVGANFRALLRLADSPLPLPFGGIEGNARSLIFIANLVSAVRAALAHPAASGRFYLVRDGEDVSTAALIGRLRRAFDRPPHLFAAPRAALAAAGWLARRPQAVRRLAGSLAVDDGRIRAELDWQPPFTLDQGLAATAAWHRAATALGR